MEIVIVYEPQDIAGSSNGRTLGFGPSDRGSSPCPAAKINNAREGVVYFKT